MKKIKTYVITLSKVFLVGHPKAGSPTDFADKLKSGIKIHTIRCNYDLWAERVAEINAGQAILSIRQWIDKPYRSKQIEIMQLTKVGLQKLQSMDNTHAYGVGNKGNVLPVSLLELAQNDGLNYPDFIDWFKNSKPTPNSPMAIIHFTNFRYFK